MSAGLSMRPFLDALNRTLADMADEHPSNSDIVRCEGERVVSDVTASVGIFGPEPGSLILVMNAAVARDLCKRTTGRSDTELEDRLVLDAVGELINMIVGVAGGASSVRFDFSLPVSTGVESHEVRILRSTNFEKVVSKISSGEVALYLVHGRLPPAAS